MGWGIICWGICCCIKTGCACAWGGSGNIIVLPCKNPGVSIGAAWGKAVGCIIACCWGATLFPCARAASSCCIICCCCCWIIIICCCWKAIICCCCCCCCNNICSCGGSCCCCWGILCCGMDCWGIPCCCIICCGMG